MFLTAEEIEEFKKITQEVKGLKLTDEQALDQGIRLIVLFSLMNKKSKEERDNVIETFKAKGHNR